MTEQAAAPLPPDLQAAVDRLYRCFGRGPIPNDFRACCCDVCMSDEMYESIAGCPNEQLSPEMIRQYSSSAHDVPENLDELRLFLPRYAELIGQRIQVDSCTIGIELNRFGSADRAPGGFYHPDERAALVDWARLVIVHLGLSDELDEQSELWFADEYAPWYLMEMLLIGNLTVDEVRPGFDRLFEHPTGSITALRRFAGSLLFHHAGGKSKFDFYGLSAEQAGQMPALADWLNRPQLKTHYERLLEWEIENLPKFDVAHDMLLTIGSFTPFMLGAKSIE